MEAGKAEASRPVRVAQVIGKMNTGGVESVVFNYYQAIDHAKYQFDFYYDADSSAEPPERLIEMGARFIRVPPYQRLFPYMASLVRAFRKEKYTIVHAHLNTLNIFPLFAARLAGTPVRIAHAHSTANRGEGMRTALKYILRPFSRLFANRLAACSRHAGVWQFGERAYRQDAVKWIPNAINVEKYGFKPEVRAEVRRNMGLENRFVIGHVGRFVFQKNHDFLIDVFREIHRRDPEAVLLLAGEGDLMEPIRRKVVRLGLEKAVYFLGVRPDVDRLYQAMDVLILPSWYEGLGLAAIEAQACGLPSLLSDQVPLETGITESAEYIRLADGPERWADSALAHKNTPRSDVSEAVRRAGYDLRKAAVDLEIWYSRDCRKTGA